MTLGETKKAMLAYRDFYGGRIMWIDEIKQAKTKKQLEKLLHQWEMHLESMADDARSHIGNFRAKIGLTYLP